MHLSLTEIRRCKNVCRDWRELFEDQDGVLEHYSPISVKNHTNYAEAIGYFRQIHGLPDDEGKYDTKDDYDYDYDYDYIHGLWDEYDLMADNWCTSQKKSRRSRELARRPRKPYR